MTQIVIISDTHSYHNAMEHEIPGGDILIHCGDFTSNGKEHEIRNFSKWFDRLPHPFKILCAGNHDRLLETDPGLAKMQLSHGIIYLENQSVMIGNLTIHATPYQPNFCNWAFNRTEEELFEIYSYIPEDTDILITHCPPYGILDECPDGSHAGSTSLAQIVAEVKPKIHCFGHIHGATGYEHRDGVLYVNASICTEGYEPANMVHMVTINYKKEIESVETF